MKSTIIIKLIVLIGLFSAGIAFATSQTLVIPVSPSGQFLKDDLTWATATGSGTVTSVNFSVPIGLTIANNPITTNGTLALALTSGYVIPLTASTTAWNDHLNVLTAKGDLAIYSTTNDRLPVGTNGQNLFASSTVSAGLEWGTFALASSTPADPTGTTTTVGMMTGSSAIFTPTKTGRVLITISGDMANGTKADGIAVQIRYGTGAAPANGTLVTQGTAAGSVIKATNANLTSFMSAKFPFTATAIVTGLTVNTAYWIEPSQASVTGGTSNIYDISITAVEF